MWQPQRLVGALLALVSAILLLVSSFLPLFIGTVRARSTEFTMTIGAWGFDTDAPVQFGAVAVNAYGLIFSAAALFAATVTSFVGARRLAAPSSRRAATVVTAVAVAFTLGVTGTVLPQVTNWAETFRPLGLASAKAETSIGIGFWLMAIGALAALAAAVLAAIPVRYREPVTPAYGFPVPVMPAVMPPAGPAPTGFERPQPEQPQPEQPAEPAAEQPAGEQNAAEQNAAHQPAAVSGESGAEQAKPVDAEDRK